jgi:hypothetical protein
MLASYIYIVDADPIISGGGGVLINNFNLTSFFLTVRNQDLNIHRNMSWAVLCSIVWHEGWLLVLLLLVELLTTNV